ncbi:hypothetical protein KAR91_51170 [Candidatus Pacearchaeota archaeon]|nr:hypothetical protein [Candidatus Pacearchaeota archaeon]
MPQQPPEIDEDWGEDIQEETEKRKLKIEEVLGTLNDNDKKILAITKGYSPKEIMLAIMLLEYTRKQTDELIN